MKKPYNIVFMGTPAFAVPSLTALHHSRHTVIHVVTQPDRPSGRGRKIGPPPVKAAARAFGYPVVQPAKVKTDAFVETLTLWQPDILVVAAYGHILPKAVLEIPSAGCVNVHGSILPNYRGAAPIQWAIINGEKETGITTMMMDVGMDTGDILLTAKETIRPEDTAATLHGQASGSGGRSFNRHIEPVGGRQPEGNPAGSHPSDNRADVEKRRRPYRLGPCGRCHLQSHTRGDPLARGFHLHR